MIILLYRTPADGGGAEELDGAGVVGRLRVAGVVAAERGGAGGFSLALNVCRAREAARGRGRGWAARRLRHTLVEASQLSPAPPPLPPTHPQTPSLFAFSNRTPNRHPLLCRLGEAWWWFQETADRILHRLECRGAMSGRGPL